MLLTFVGDETYEIYENIMPPGDHNYADVLAEFDSHFKPQVNVSYETYLFHQMQQRVDESIHQYYIRLKEQGSKCTFTNVDTAIKQHRTVDDKQQATTLQFSKSHQNFTRTVNRR